VLDVREEERGSSSLKTGRSPPFFRPNNTYTGLRPLCYIFKSSDLKPVHHTNLLVKYADDTYLIIPGSNSSLIPDELSNITQ